MYTAQLQNLDIEEAKIMISIKNDEINKLKATLKTQQIKSNLRQADLKFKMDQIQHKMKTGETKQLKTSENLKKQKEDLYEELKKLQQEIEKLKQANETLCAAKLSREREFNSFMIEQNLKAEGELEEKMKVRSELEIVLKYFDPKLVMTALQKPNLDDIPSYLTLYAKFMDSQEALSYANLQMSNLRQEIISQMKESSQKFTNYESVMNDLKDQNEQLRNSIQQKQFQLQRLSQENNSKRQLIQRIKEENNFHLEHLSTEIITLKEAVANYESQNIGNPRDKDAPYRQKIQELDRKLMQKDLILENLSKEFQDKVNHLQQQNNNIKVQLEELNTLKNAQFQEYTADLLQMERDWEQKKEIISLLKESSREQELVIDQLNRELERRNQEIKTLIDKSMKIEENYRIREQRLLHQLSNDEKPYNQLQAQSYPIDQVKNKRQSIRKESLNNSNQQVQPKKIIRVMSNEEFFQNVPKSMNLLEDLTDNLTYGVESEKSNVDLSHFQQMEKWPLKYHQLLLKHNKFVKIVQGRLKKLLPQH